MKRKDDIVFSSSPLSLSGTISILWRITEYCNYNCFYCHPKSQEKVNIDVLKVVDFILNLKNKKIHIILNGRESTTHPKLLDAIKYLIEQSVIKDKVISIFLFSNLSESIDYYDSFFTMADDYTNIKMTLFSSFHREFTNLNVFLDKFKYLYEKKYDLRPFAFMTYSPTCVSLINSIKDEIIKHPFLITPLLNNKFDMKGLEKSIIEKASLPKQYVIYHKNGEYFYDYTYIQDQCFKGFICNTFKDHILIQEDGTIQSCQLLKDGKKLTIFNDTALDYINEHDHILCPYKHHHHCEQSLTKIDFRHYEKLKNIDEKYILENIKKL